jgi:hypothetical protein
MHCMPHDAQLMLMAAVNACRDRANSQIERSLPSVFKYPAEAAWPGVKGHQDSTKNLFHCSPLLSKKTIKKIHHYGARRAFPCFRASE